MTDEEKKAIEKLKWYFEDSQGLDITKQATIVLNIIEKQSKEIEELKRNKNFLEKQEIEYIRDRTEDEINYRWEYKIKAKIEELDYNDIGNFERRCKQEVLQSLLEKE